MAKPAAIAAPRPPIVAAPGETAERAAARIALLERRLARAEKARAAAEALLERKSRVLAQANAELLARKEHLLADLERRTRQLLDAQRVAGFGTLIWDQRASRLEVSPQIRVLLGLDAHAQIDDYRHMLSGVDPADLQKVADWLERDLQRRTVGENDHYVEFRSRPHPDGRGQKWLRAMAQVERDAEGRPSVIFGTIQDVTRQNQAAADAAALREREQQQLDDLQRLNGELTQARENAERANAAKSRFLAMMSHDIRTPLNGVVGMLALLEEDGLNAAQRRTVSLARASGEQLRVLLDDIIDLARAEAGKFKLSPTPTDLSALVTDGAAFWHNSARAKGLTLTCDINPNLPRWVLVDRVRLRQLVDNLLSNAIKYTASGGVWVSARFIAGSRLRVEVRDTGLGVPEDRRKELFQDFAQLQLQGSEPGGAGLGLAICLRITQAMNGVIGFTGAAPGSTFWFEIPLSVVTAPARIAADDSAPLTTADGRAVRVLVAEDVETNRIVAEGHLRRLGCEVVVVNDGQAAVEAARVGGFDLVLMDMAMPVMDGPAATRAIRALPGAAGLTPVIALTAYARPEELAPMMEAGAAGAACKPIVVDDLRRVIRATLERAQP